MPKTARSTVKIGDTFRSVIADANVLWRVVRQIDASTYECEAVNEPIEFNGQMYDSDYAGSVRPFFGDEIARAKALESLFTSHNQADEQFWHALPVGSTVHTKGPGRETWVRCEVVIDDKGDKALRPLALVGQWRAYDLPRRDARGEIVHSYYSAKVANGEVFTTNYSNVFESGKTRATTDPATLPALDLTVPDMSADERHSAQCQRFLDEVAAAITNREASPPERLAALRAMLADSRLGL